jgi:prepilin-type N-terminal cleavage/methylation domain-containing protein
VNRRQTSRGFTLIELLLVVGIASIVGATFFSVMYMQSLSYLERLDEVDAHQNARAAVNVIRRYVRNAGWGFGSSMSANGTVTIGKCYSDTVPTASQMNCHALTSDPNNDRLRVAYIVNDSETVSTSSYSSPGPCNGLTLPIDLLHINVAQNPVTPFTNSQLLGIGGTCLDGSSASDILVFTSDAGASSGCTHRYGYSLLEGAVLSCPTGYQSGYVFGRAVVADFYVMTVGGTPQLMLRTDPRTALANGQVVAYDVEQLNVTYGIDTSNPTDRTADVWCADPRTTANGGTCSNTDTTGAAITQQGNYDRIVAVTITVKIRTDMKRTNLPGSADGYRHYTYSTTIALRNVSI